MRKCKKCGVSKEYRFFAIDGQSRSVYKDEFGNIWHGRVCYDCFKGYVKDKSGKTPLGVIECAFCEKKVKQKTGVQKTCSQACYDKLIAAIKANLIL